MDKTQPFPDIWDVVRQERRIRGEWQHEYDFARGEWMIAFLEEGRYSEIFRPGGMPEEITTYGRTFDAASGIISLHPDGMPRDVVRTMVFDETDNETYLYLFEDAPHIPPDRDIIIAHHSGERLRLTNISGVTLDI